MNSVFFLPNYAQIRRTHAWFGLQYHTECRSCLCACKLFASNYLCELSQTGLAPRVRGRADLGRFSQ